MSVTDEQKVLSRYPDAHADGGFDGYQLFTSRVGGRALTGVEKAEGHAWYEAARTIERSDRIFVRRHYPTIEYKSGIGWNAGLYTYDSANGWKLIEVGFDPEVWTVVRDRLVLSTAA